MEPMLDVKHLYKWYNEGSRKMAAVNDVSFQLFEGESLGVVGESGSGKSTIARLLLGLTNLDQGEILWRGEPIHILKGKKLREFRKHIQVVFQDPTSALSPRLPVYRSVMEPLGNFSAVIPSFLEDVRGDMRKTAVKLLQMVGLSEEHMDRYPHELSGGQRQRVAIARGISLGPDLLICDEPTSSLDVTVQAQILKMLKELQHKIGMSTLFISHDIASVANMTDRILVMKNGEVVDLFRREEIYEENRHAYTKLLVSKVH
ncbi:ABC transporters ATP-binding protein [Paenibacillus sp. TCA20]|nr:ABC transporters ATP-binding protein [Paenibacillus sp. TCA20]